MKLTKLTFAVYSIIGLLAVMIVACNMDTDLNDLATLPTTDENIVSETRSTFPTLGYFNLEEEFTTIVVGELECYYKSIGALGNEFSIEEYQVVDNEDGSSQLVAVANSEDSWTSIKSSLHKMDDQNYAMAAMGGGKETCTCTSTNCWPTSACQANTSSGCDCWPSCSEGSCTKTHTIETSLQIAQVFNNSCIGNGQNSN